MTLLRTAILVGLAWVVGYAHGLSTGLDENETKVVRPIALHDPDGWYNARDD